MNGQDANVHLRPLQDPQRPFTRAFLGFVTGRFRRRPGRHRQDEASAGPIRSLLTMPPSSQLEQSSRAQQRPRTRRANGKRRVRLSTYFPC